MALRDEQGHALAMKTYPAVETCYSLQGEGYWTGTPMCFIRLAGCSVGGKSGMCTPAFGEPFLCDTDYSCSQNVLVDTLVDQAVASKARHVCITGGEPFDHDLGPLVNALGVARLKIHIETSGTKEIKSDLFGACDWITLSPKKGVLSGNFAFAAEVKVLVSASTIISDIQDIETRMPYARYKYLQPVTIYHKTPNGPRVVQPSTNTDLCISFLLHHFPSWKLSLQTHNMIGVR